MAGTFHRCNRVLEGWCVGVFRDLIDLRPIAKKAQENGALLIAVFTEVVSLGLIESHGAMGADIVVGEGQSIGNALNFGGPYVGLFTAKEKYIRQMPGRLCGETVDADGKRGYVLTLSTREQHIRREKATSNICTNSGLCCLAFTIHLSLLGEEGLTLLARINQAGGRVSVTVDLEACIVVSPDGEEFSFQIDPKERTMLLQGLDEIGITLKYQADIDAFAERDRAERPWMYRENA